MYVCEKCGSRFSSARFAHIELCPRCLLRDDFPSHLVYVPGNDTRRAPDSRRSPKASSEPDAASAELG